VYAFAGLLYEIAVRRPIFAGQIGLVDWAWRMAYEVRSVVPIGVEPSIRGIIEKGWATDPAARPSFVEIYEEIRLNDFCVVRDGFRPGDVEVYVRWVDRSGVGVEAVAPPVDDAQCTLA
jgi:hypothetical protein